MAGKLAKIPAETKARAKDLYFQWKSHNDICEELKLSSSVLAKWRTDEGWDAERKALDEGMIADLFQGRKLKMAKLAEMSINQLERGLLHLKERHEPLSLGEMEKLSVILSNLDKITRLDLNRATENVAMNINVQGQLTVDRIREIMTQDPFVGPESKE